MVLQEGRVGLFEVASGVLAWRLEPRGMRPALWICFIGSVVASLAGMGAPASARVQIGLPAISYSDGDVGLSQLGIANGIILELAGDPAQLKRPQSQAFVDAFFKHLSVALSDGTQRHALAELRPAFVVGDDYDLNQSESTALNGFKGLMFGMPQTSLRAYVFGMIVQQVNDNAHTAKSRAEDVYYRSALERINDIDESIDGLPDARIALLSDQPGDWGAIGAHSAALLKLILSA
jgi:hypothetical protein